MTNTDPAALTADDAPEVGTERYTIGISSLLALTPAQCQALVDIATYDPHPASGMHAARRQVLEARGLITSQRVGTGRGAWTRADLTDRGRDVVALELADRRDQDVAMAELADEATDREQIDTTASAHGWAMFATTHRHYGFRRWSAWVSASFSEHGAVLDAERIIDGQQNREHAPVGDRLETVLGWLSAGDGVTSKALTSGNTDSDRIAELEAQLAQAVADRDAALRRADLQATDYRLARERITELEDQRGPLRAAARGLRSDFVIMDEIFDDPEPAQPATVRDALVALDLDPMPGLPGEGQLIRESVRYGTNPTLVRVIGTLGIADGDDGADVLRTDDRHDAIAVPVRYVADYVGLVRALGSPGPARRRAALAEVLAASMPHR